MFGIMCLITDWGLDIVSFAQAGLGEILREWNQLDRADQLIQESQTHYSQAGAGYLEWYFSPDLSWLSAKNRLLHGDFDEAEELIQVTNSKLRTYHDIPYLAARNQALEVQLWLAKGDLPRAAEWARETQVRLGELDDRQAVILKIALARVFLAQGQAGQAVELFTENAYRDALPIYRIEMQILKALALCQVGDRSTAITAILLALDLAAPGGYVRIFVDEGPAMMALLSETLKVIERNQSQEEATLPTAGYIKELLPNFGIVPLKKEKQLPTSIMLDPLPEPLSKRELEVLALLADGLSSKQLARQLVISVNTARTHIKNIYQKLDAHNREEAIERAISMNLL